MGGSLLKPGVSRLLFWWGGVWSPGENFLWWSCISGPSPWCPESSPSPPSLVSFSPFLFLLLFLLCFSSCYGLFVGVPSTNSCAEAVLPRWWCLEVGFGEVIGFGRSQGVEPQWWHWCPYTVMKRAELFLGLVRIRWEGGCLQARKWVLTRTQAFSLQDCEE